MSEFKALQMLALYNGPGGAEATGDNPNPDDTANLMDQTVSDALADEGKKCKHMEVNLEEFLLQQACMHEWSQILSSVSATRSWDVMSSQ
jgi:hypothetical protein